MVEFSPPTPDKRQPRCPCVLVLDTSQSMAKDDAISKMNAALASLSADLSTDSLAMKRVEVALVGFPPVQTLHPFSTPDEFAPPTLHAEGTTPLGAAVHHALRIIDERKRYYQSVHIDWYRPWIFLITDGEPDPGDDWRGAALAVRDAEARNKVAFFGVGVPGADMNVLREFSARPPLNLLDLRFRDMFVWLSNSLKATANSNSHSGGDPNEKVKLHTLDWGTL